MTFSSSDQKTTFQTKEGERESAGKQHICAQEIEDFERESTTSGLFRILSYTQFLWLIFLKV